MLIYRVCLTCVQCNCDLPFNIIFYHCYVEINILSHMTRRVGLCHAYKPRRAQSLSVFCGKNNRLACYVHKSIKHHKLLSDSKNYILCVCVFKLRHTIFHPLFFLCRLKHNRKVLPAASMYTFDKQSFVRSCYSLSCSALAYQESVSCPRCHPSCAYSWV